MIQLNCRKIIAEQKAKSLIAAEQLNPPGNQIEMIKSAEICSHGAIDVLIALLEIHFVLGMSNQNISKKEYIYICLKNLSSQ